MDRGLACDATRSSVPVTTKSLVAQATVIGADPARAAELHAQAQRIGRRMKTQLSHVKSPAARQHAMAIANALIDAAVAETIEDAMAQQVRGLAS